MSTIEKPKPELIGVSERALLQRINRALAPQLRDVRKSRDQQTRLDVGNYYTVDHRINGVVGRDVDLVALGRELGVLREWETVR